MGNFSELVLSKILINQENLRAMFFYKITLYSQYMLQVRNKTDENVEFINASKNGLNPSAIHLA